MPEQSFLNADPSLWTRLRCARGHLDEHPGGVTAADLDGSCWCGGVRIAATVYKITETAGHRPTRTVEPWDTP